MFLIPDALLYISDYILYIKNCSAWRNNYDLCMVCMELFRIFARKIITAMKVRSTVAKVTVCVPCFNEVDTIALLYRTLVGVFNDIPSCDFELLAVDDGSTDGTLDVLYGLNAEDSRVQVLSFSRNFGKEAALMAAIDYAGGDCVVLMDADGQDPPELIPQMLHWWREGYDDVYARRTDRGREGWLRRQLSLLFYDFMSKMTDVDMPSDVGDFRLLDRQVVLSLRELREVERYNKGLFSWVGYKKKELTFERANRREGKSHFTLWKLANLAMAGITSFTAAPLRIWTLIGGVIAMGAFCFLIFYIAKTLIIGDPVQGFTTLVSIILFLGGIQLLSVGILGEYIARLYSESKHRPMYVIKEQTSTIPSRENRVNDKY